MTGGQRRPNLFLVGAMKCGTTSLHNMLDAHPSIFMCQNPKEPAWFAGGNQSKDLSWYLERFADARDERYVGESSTDYSKAPRLGPVASRIKEFSPDARILYIMRDPVERAISHYWWEVEFSAEGRSFLEAVKASREIGDVGNYAMQIEPFLKVFGRDRVCTLTMEELTAAPVQTMGRLYDFLDIERVDASEGSLAHENQGKSQVPRVSGPFSRFKGTPLWAAAKAMIPPALRKRAIAALAKPVERSIAPAEMEAALAVLRPRVRKETEALSRLLGRDFPEWPSASGAEG